MHFGITHDRPPLRVGLAGLGSIGIRVAQLLDHGNKSSLPGAVLHAVAASDRDKARARLANLTTIPRVGSLGSLADCDVVLEMLPSRCFADIAVPTIERGGVLIVASVGAMLSRLDLIDRARATGARIIVPSGAIPGLDALKAAAEGTVNSVVIETRKSPASLAGAPYLIENAIDVHTINKAATIFVGSARQAALAFPANTNVAAALSLAGIGPDKTEVRIIADPDVDRNIHKISVNSDSARFECTVEIVPNKENPRSGELTPRSIIACLRDLTQPIRIGT
ncbi:MAG: aspartate dehydrogenase [Acetobacter sp.]|uniref:aspartate dehydrogenase n=1 Tax=Acetobacter sp. TaxID=440 RepID=UPI0039E74E75